MLNAESESTSTVERRSFAFYAIRLALSDLTGAILALMVPFAYLSFECNYAIAALLPCSYYLSYAIVSIAAGRVCDRIGRRRTFRLSALVGMVGSGGVAFAAINQAFGLVCIAAMLLGWGSVLNHVATNSSLSSLPGSSVTRLNRAHGIACMAIPLSPFIGSVLATLFHSPFVIFVGTLTLLATTWSVAALVAPPIAPVIVEKRQKGPWLTPQLWIAGVAMIFDLGAMVSAETLLVHSLHHPSGANLSLVFATWLANLFYVGIIVGRLVIAPALLRSVPSLFLLMLSMTVSIVALVSAALIPGVWGVVPILLFGVTRSAIFPTVLGIELNRAGTHAGKVSGFLYASSLGAAIFPFINGIMTEKFWLGSGLLLAAAGYLLLGVYALKASTQAKTQIGAAQN